MTVRINKPAINLREKLAELDKPSGIVGEQVLRSDTAEDAREALNLEEHLFENFESTGIQDNATSTKVTVSDAGVDVTGTITADSLTVSNSASIATIIESTTTTVGFDLKDSASFTRFTNSNGTFKIDSNDDGTGGTSDIVLAQSGVERLRIEDNGDVLFYEDTGTTAKMVWDASAEQLGVGTASPIAPLDVNRTSSDGIIANFRKDGAPVGSIGTVSGDLEIHSSGANHVGLRFANGYISPVDNSGALIDGVADLGTAAYKYKDLYLSGGVFLGGTGAANKLDDYEEGTWTPEYESVSGDFGSISYNLQAGRYVKVGNMVMITARLRIDTFTVGTASGNLLIKNLPFTAQTESNTGLASVPLNTQQGWVNMPTMGYVEGADTKISLTTTKNAANTYEFITVDDMSTGSSTNRVRFSAVYYAV